MVTSRDVARVAGVSQATVSRVLAGSPVVRPDTRDRVLRALAATGYVPNQAARAMRTRRSGAVGVIVGRITNPFYPELLTALSRTLGEADQRMVLWDAEGPGAQTAVDAIRQRVVDGLIFTTATADLPPLVQALASSSPVVLVNRALRGVVCDQVTSDNRAGGRLVAGYLAAHGHRRCGLVSGPRGISTGDDREAGYRAGLDASGLRLPAGLVVHGEFSHADGYSAMCRLLDQDDPPTAVFCTNDLIAFGARDAARALGVRVPEDLWLVGYDDIPMASWQAFDLTTVRQPLGAIADLAVELLLARIADPERPPQTHRLPAELIVRGSTAGAPADVPARASRSRRRSGA
jgi:LacI family transcriptional regulator